MSNPGPLVPLSPQGGAASLAVSVRTRRGPTQLPLVVTQVVVLPPGAGGEREHPRRWPPPTHAALALGGASVAVRPSEIEGAGLGAFALREWAAAEWIAACDRALLGHAARPAVAVLLGPEHTAAAAQSHAVRQLDPARRELRLAQRGGSAGARARQCAVLRAHGEKLVEKGAELLVDGYSSAAGGSLRLPAHECHLVNLPPLHLAAARGWRPPPSRSLHDLSRFQHKHRVCVSNTNPCY